MPRPLRLAPIIVLLATALAGCGPDDPVSSSDPPTTQGPSKQAVVVGTVSDAKGGPVAGVLIVPTSLDQPPKAVPELAVTTDAQGEYTWTLAPGRYAFAPRKPGIARKEVTLLAGQTTIVDFKLP